MPPSARLLVGNVWTRIEGQEALVDQALTFRQPGYQFSPAFKRGKWDGYIHLVRQRKGESVFPTGLLAHVMGYCSGFGKDFEVVDARRQPSSTHHAVQLTGLDAAQEEAVRKALYAGQGVIQFPTGTGKTVVLAEILRVLGDRSLVLCNTKVLLEQLQRELNHRLNILIGSIGDGHWVPREITVATVQTLYGKLRDRTTRDEVKAYLETIQCVVCDEAHHLGADSFSYVMEALPNAYWRFGLSATPHRSRSSGKVDRVDPATYFRVTGWTGPVITKLGTEEAVESGRIVPADIIMVKGTAWKGSPFNYTDAVEQGIIANWPRHFAVQIMVDNL